MLEKAPLPNDVIALGVDGIRKIWHDKKMRGRVLLKIGQRPWLKQRTIVLVLMVESESRVSYICCLKRIAYGLLNRKPLTKSLKKPFLRSNMWRNYSPLKEWEQLQ